MEPEMMILVRTNLSTSIGVEISPNATIGDLLSHAETVHAQLHPEHGQVQAKQLLKFRQGDNPDDSSAGFLVLKDCLVKTAFANHECVLIDLEKATSEAFSSSGKKKRKPKTAKATTESKAAEDAPTVEESATPVAEPKESGKGAKAAKGKTAKAKAEEDVPPKDGPFTPAAATEEPPSSPAPLVLTGKRKTGLLAGAFVDYNATKETAGGKKKKKKASK